MRSLRTRLAVASAALVVAACGSSSGASVGPTVSASPGALATGTPVASTLSVSVAPLTTAWPTFTPVPSIDAASIHCLPQAWTGMMLLDATDGSEIAWTSGEQDEWTAPDVYAWKPGELAPTAIFRPSNRNTEVDSVSVHHGKYAFEEMYTNKDKTWGWRLWYVEARGAKPIIVDSSAGDPQGTLEPVIDVALTDSQMSWSAIHVVNGVEIWSLRSHSFATGTTRTLVEAPRTQTEYWFPDADDKGRLVYSTVEYQKYPDLYTAKYHVYMVNLADDPVKPVRLDPAGSAAEPVLVGDGDTVVWKSIAAPESVVSWGTWERHSLSTGETRTIILTEQQGVDYFQAGNRFVAGWVWNSNSLDIYDLQTDSSLWIEQHDPRSTIGGHWAIVGGDLLVYIRGDDSLPGGKNKWLCYVNLPPRS